MNSEDNQVFNLLLIEYIFSKKSTQQKSIRKKSAWIEPLLKNRMYTSVFNNVFAELMVNDKEGFLGYLRISTASYHSFFFA